MALRDIPNKFMSAVASEMETAQARLAELEAQKADRIKLRGELAAAAVKAGLDDEGALEAYRTEDRKLAEIDGLIDATHTWIAELEQKERDRQRQARISADKSRVRALTQHIRQFDKLDIEQEKNIAAVIENWRERHAQAEKITKLIPPTELYENPAYRRFSGAGMFHAEARELVHQGYFGQGLSDYRGPASYPGVMESRGLAIGAAGHEDLVHEMAGMAAEGKEASDWAIRAFSASLGLQSDVAASDTTPITIAKPLASPEAPKPQILVMDADGSRLTSLGDPLPPQQLSVSRPGPDQQQAPGPLPVPKNDGPVFAHGRSQVPQDRPRATPEEMDAAANRTLHSIASASIPIQSAVPSDMERAAEATAAAVKNAPRNPHPPGTEAYEETERVLARMSRPANPVADAFEAMERQLRSEGE